MVNVYQAALSLLSLPLKSVIYQVPQFPPLPEPSYQPSKSIAIIGAGSAGLAALKTLLDLPQDTRKDWYVVVFEQRRDVGGIWLEDPRKPNPPELPETPLYPSLRTNTPHAFMTYPNFPFPPMTNLYPNHEFVYRYHIDYAQQFGLMPYILFNHTVLVSSWVGDPSSGKWNITFRDHQNRLMHKPFDHIISANGHNQYPNIPAWSGQGEWLRNSSPTGPKREILHTIFWRDPHRYAGRSVLVVGGGASGQDVALHTGPVARQLFISLKEGKPLPAPLPFPAVTKPPISHFTAKAVFFTDGTSESDIDAIILGTGYEVRVPFLDAGNALVTNSSASCNASRPNNSPGLTSNLRYLFPLHEHIFSLAPQYPPTALSFVGLPALIANCPSDIAQALLVAHAIANASLLPSRDEMRALLRTREDALRKAGFDPDQVGHRLVGEGTDLDYQDRIVDYVKKRGAIPDDGRPFVRAWRRWMRNNGALVRRAWARVEALGMERDWLRGAKTEDDWADMLYRLAAWEKKVEEAEGLRREDHIGEFEYL